MPANFSLCPAKTLTRDLRNGHLATSFSAILFAIANPVFVPASSAMIGHAVADCVWWYESWYDVSHRPWTDVPVDGAVA
jgi:hypothetical protein